MKPVSLRLAAGTRWPLLWLLWAFDGASLPGAESPLAAGVSPTATNTPGFVLEILHRTLVAPWLKSAGDLNGDGRIDLVAGAAQQGGLVAFLNQSPRWQREVIDPERKFSTDGEVADLDGDGRADFVAITLDPAAVVWYRATTTGWEPRTLSTESWHDLEVADLDRDGRPDLVGRAQKEWPAGDDDGNRLHLLWQKSAQGAVEWEETHLPCPPGEGLLVTDLDGDGDPDVVINGVWMENRGGRRFTSRSYAGESGWGHPNAFIAAGDLNGDGRTDLVLAPSELQGQRYRISWLEQPSAAAESPWREHTIIPGIETVCHFVGVADFDRDGRADVAVAEMTQGTDPDEVFLCYNRGRRDQGVWLDVWEKQVLSDAGSHSMRIVDVEGDGWPDLFGANWSANGKDEDIKLWRNAGVGVACLSLSATALAAPPSWDAPPPQKQQGQPLHLLLSRGAAQDHRPGEWVQRLPVRARPGHDVLGPPARGQRGRAGGTHQHSSRSHPTRPRRVQRGREDRTAGGWGGLHPRARVSSVGLEVAERIGSRVVLFAPHDLPVPFWSRANQQKTCTFDLDVDSARIEKAELNVITWTGGAGTVKEYFTLNGIHYPVAEGSRHELIYSRLPVDPKTLKRGLNRIELLSDTEQHGIEVIHPGPALLVRYHAAPD